jgi:nucleoid-associated protein YgaU
LAARAGGGPAVLSDALSIDAGIQPPALAGAPLPVPPAPAAAEARDTAVVPAPAPVEARGSDASPKRAAMPPPAAVKPVTARSAVVLAAPSAPLPSTPASIAIDAAPPRAKAAPAPALAAAAPPPAFVPRNLAAAPKLSYSAPASKSRFVSVQSVEATRDGRLFVKGAADPNTILHLYLNGSLLAAAAAGADRQWSLTIEHGMSEGDYVLRAEEVDPAGGVLARADAPFTYPQHPSASGPPLRFSAASPQVLPPPPEPVANKPAEAAFKPAPLAVETRPPASVEPVEPHKPIVAASPVVTAFASPPPIPAPAAPGPMIALAPLAAVPGAAGEPVSRPPSVPSEPQAAPPPTLAAAPLESPVPLSEPALSTPPANVVIENVQTTTVVRGDNLWDLARHFYGDGTRFKDLYAANASQIHEPRLIFIGQKFVVPKLATP